MVAIGPKNNGSNGPTKLAFPTPAAPPAPLKPIGPFAAIQTRDGVAYLNVCHVSAIGNMGIADTAVMLKGGSNLVLAGVTPSAVAKACATHWMRHPDFPPDEAPADTGEPPSPLLKP